MPTTNPWAREEWAAGYGGDGAVVSVQKQIIRGPSAAGSHYLTPTSILTCEWTPGVPGMTLREVSTSSTEIRPLRTFAAVHFFCGGGGRWAAYTDEGVFVDGVRVVGIAPLGFGPDGTFAHFPFGGQGLWLDGVQITDAVVADVKVFGRGRASWREGFVPKHVGLDWPEHVETVPGQVYWLSPFQNENGSWELCYNSSLGVVAHPVHDASRGRILQAAGGDSFRLDCNGLIAVWSLSANDGPPLDVLRSVYLSDYNIVPLTPEDEMESPRVHVTKWDLDELHDGREFIFEDANNPDLGYRARVFIENGSMYAEIQNKVGAAQTGLRREVKPCPEPEPGPEPKPPPMRRQAGFGPNLGSEDFLALFTDLDAWAWSRDHISVFHFFINNLELGPHEDPAIRAWVGPNYFQHFVEVDAFKKLAAWGIPIEVETSDDANRVISAMERVESAGGAVHAIAYDHAFIELSSDEYAQRAQTIIEAYPETVMGVFCPFPTIQASGIRQKFNELAVRGALPDFLRLDVDPYQRSKFTSAAFQSIRAVCDEWQVALQVVINARDRVTDAEYAQETRTWFNYCLSLGRWDAFMVECWGGPENGRRLQPHNLPESDASSHTSIVRHVIERLPEPTPGPEPEPEPDPRSTWIRTVWGTYWGEAPDGTAVQQTVSESQAARYLIEEVGGGDVSIQSVKTKKYACAENGGAEDKIIFNRDAVNPWERFSLAGHTDFSLRAVNSRYACAEDDRRRITIHRESPGSWESFVRLPPSGVGGDVVPLRRDGLNFMAGDQIWKLRSVTGFRAPELMAKGEAGWVEDYYGWIRSLGGNAVRWFAMWNNTKYSPLSVPNYYDKIEHALEHAKASGLYVHLTAFCDQVEGSDVLLTTSQQDEHVHRLVDILRRTGSGVLELVNEDFKNGEFSHRFPADWFTGVLTTRSTWEDDHDPEEIGTYLDWVIKHTDRGDDFAVKGKVLHEAERQGLGDYPPAHLPCASTEPRRIAEGTTPRQHADDTAVCELFGLGRCLHGGYSTIDSDHESDLQNCKVPGPGLALDCCNAVGEVWRANFFDPNAHAIGQYVRGVGDGSSGECPIYHHDSLALRTYFMIIGNVAYGLAVDPRPGWTLQPANGWQLDAQVGYQGNLIRMKR